MHSYSFIQRSPVDGRYTGLFVEHYEYAVLEHQKQPPVVFYKKTVRKNFGILTEKHLSWSLFNEEGLQVY